MSTLTLTVTVPNGPPRLSRQRDDRKQQAAVGGSAESKLSFALKEHACANCDYDLKPLKYSVCCCRSMTRSFTSTLCRSVYATTYSRFYAISTADKPRQVEEVSICRSASLSNTDETRSSPIFAFQCATHGNGCCSANTVNSTHDLPSKTRLHRLLREVMSAWMTHLSRGKRKPFIVTTTVLTTVLLCAVSWLPLCHGASDSRLAMTREAAAHAPPPLGRVINHQQQLYLDSDTLKVRAVHMARKTFRQAAAGSNVVDAPSGRAGGRRHTFVATDSFEPQPQQIRTVPHGHRCHHQHQKTNQVTEKSLWSAATEVTFSRGGMQSNLHPPRTRRPRGLPRVARVVTPTSQLAVTGVEPPAALLLASPIPTTSPYGALAATVDLRDNVVNMASPLLVEQSLPAEEASAAVRSARQNHQPDRIDKSSSAAAGGSQGAVSNASDRESTVGCWPCECGPFKRHAFRVECNGLVKRELAADSANASSLVVDVLRRIGHARAITAL